VADVDRLKTKVGRLRPAGSPQNILDRGPREVLPHSKVAALWLSDSHGNHRTFYTARVGAQNISVRGVTAQRRSVVMDVESSAYAEPTACSPPKIRAVCRMRDDTLTVDRPPKPRLALRVGITGHRPNKLNGPAIEQAQLQLGRVFAAIRSSAAEILKDNAPFYSSEVPQIRLVCGFAEGADQLAVSACPSDWIVEAILPFPKEEYFEDFYSSALGDGRNVQNEFLESIKRALTITQFPLPGPERRDQGYVNAGSYLLRQIDLLIAVWDGKTPKPGGTGALAREAFDGRIPVIWLSTCGARVPRLITDFDANGTPVAPEADCTEGPLLTALQPLFAGPSLVSNRPPKSREAALDQFFREAWRPVCYLPVYDFLKRCANLQRPRVVIRARPFQDQCADWDLFLDATPDAGHLRERLKVVLLPRFVWADSLAVHFSHMYRSAYVLTYFLSAVAVFIALGGVFVDTVDRKGIVVLMEFFVIGSIISLILIGRASLWHERWLDYRALAESLRHGRFLAFVSEFGRVHDSASGQVSREPPWTLWYVRATMRGLGLPSAIFDFTYQWRILNATLTYEIDEQLKYHTDNSRSVHRIDHLLHDIGIACFLITFIILGLFLVGYGYEYLFGDLTTASVKPVTWLGQLPFFLKHWMFVCTAGLPALGAALAGIRVHGDFESAEEHSERMTDSLALLKGDYTAAMRREGTFDDTAQRLIATSRVMTEDLASWHDLYGRKRLVLPA
jgi:hypothetical protein